MEALWDRLTERHPIPHPGLRILGVTIATCLIYGVLVFAIASLLFPAGVPPVWFVFAVTWAGFIVGIVAMWAAYLRWSP